MKLVTTLKRCQFLLGFHLSDNNIAKSFEDQEQSLFLKLMEQFGIGEEDLYAVERSNADGAKYHRRKLYYQDNANIINYEEALKHYFTLESPSSP